MREFHVGLGIVVLILYFLTVTNASDVLPRLATAMEFGGGAGPRGRGGGFGIFLILPLVAATLFIFGPYIDDKHLPDKMHWMADPGLAPDLYYITGYCLLIFSLIGFLGFA